MLGSFSCESYDGHDLTYNQTSTSTCIPLTPSTVSSPVSRTNINVHTCDPSHTPDTLWYALGLFWTLPLSYYQFLSISASLHLFYNPSICQTLFNHLAFTLSSQFHCMVSYHFLFKLQHLLPTTVIQCRPTLNPFHVCVFHRHTSLQPSALCYFHFYF